MDASGQPSGSRHKPAQVWAGELIVQNGRQSGARRPLQVPLTLIGKDSGCDIRLNAAGIEPMHCVLAHGPDGLMIRDLNSGQGTFVNGERANSATLKDGDQLNVGSFQFRVNLPPRSFALVSQDPVERAEKGESSVQDALRLQAAAVAAQQAALGEEEARLMQRKAALERQEEQLASHLEEKRRRLLILHERAQAERRSLQQDRLAYDAHVEKISGDLGQSQRQTLENTEKLTVQRRRLAELYRRLRRRLHDQAEAEQQRLNQRDEAFARQTEDVQMENLRIREREEKLEQQRLEYHGEYTTGRNQIQLGWQRLRLAQRRWRERRAKELRIVKQRAQELETGHARLTQQCQQFQSDMQLVETRRQALEMEVVGLDRRILNQRHRIIQQQLEINRLDNLVRQRQENSVNAPLPANGNVVPASDAPTRKPDAVPSESTALVLVTDSTRFAAAKGLGAKGKSGRHKLGRGEQLVSLEIVGPSLAAPPEHDTRLREWDLGLQRRLEQLDRLAGDLADQRLLLMEQWQRLVETQHHWEKDRNAAADELEILAGRLQVQEQTLERRERAFEQAEHQFRLRHRELTHLRQHLVAWRSRLKTRENALEGERSQLLTEMQNREAMVEKHLTTLSELRRRWSRRRRQELTLLAADRTACDQLLKECNVVRQSLAEKTSELEEARRTLTEKTLALEQYRQEFFLRIDQPGAERRLDRLRRRWLSQNAQILRKLTLERENLQAELARNQTQVAELFKRQETVAHAESGLSDKLSAFEHQQALAAVRNTRLEQDLQSAESQRQLIEEQLGHMKEEVERIARQLMEEPVAASAPLERAA